MKAVSQIHSKSVGKNDVYRTVVTTPDAPKPVTIGPPVEGRGSGRKVGIGLILDGWRSTLRSVLARMCIRIVVCRGVAPTLTDDFFCPP